MDVYEYVEALEALNECCDDPLMVEPLTWTTAIQGKNGPASRVTLLIAWQTTRQGNCFS